MGVAKSSCAESLNAEKKGMTLSHYGGKLHNNATAEFTTVGKFKGLESPVIILTDVEELLSDDAAANTYIGVTRATEQLTVLIAESAKTQIADLMSGGQEA